MTNPTPHGQVPEALIDLIDAYAETRHRCGGIYNAKTEAARKAVIEALSGVQALSAAPAVLSDEAILNRTGCIDYSPGTAEYDLELIRWYRTQIASPAPQQSRPLSHPNREFPGLAQGAAITSESGAVYAPMPRAAYIEFDGREETAWHTPDQMRDFADRTHALRMEQAAPKAAPVTQQAGYECGNSYAKVKLKGEAFGSASCDHATVRWLHQTSSVGGGDPRNSRAWPKVSGVSRDEGHSRALLVFFAAEPTDDEVRAVHDTLAAAPTAQAAPQPAPATQQAGDVVAYLDVGAGGYLDLGSELSEDALQQLPKGRHALVIAGTYGIDGYVAAPQPSPTTKPAPAAQRDAEDAARYRWLRDGNGYAPEECGITGGEELDELCDEGVATQAKEGE